MELDSFSCNNQRVHCCYQNFKEKLACWGKDINYYVSFTNLQSYVILCFLQIEYHLSWQLSLQCSWKSQKDVTRMISIASIIGSLIHQYYLFLLVLRVLYADYPALPVTAELIRCRSRQRTCATQSPRPTPGGETFLFHNEDHSWPPQKWEM